jgi:hypothetical protein
VSRHGATAHDTSRPVDGISGDAGSVLFRGDDRGNADNRNSRSVIFAFAGLRESS